MMKVVADSWGRVDDETRNFLQTIYDRELAKYRNDMKEYVEMYGEGALDSQKMVYKKRRKVSTTNENNSADSSSKKSTATSRDQSTVSDTTSQPSQGSTKSSSSSNAAALHNSYLASFQMNSYTSQVSNGSNIPVQSNAMATSSSRPNQLQQDRYNAGLQSLVDPNVDSLSPSRSLLDSRDSGFGLPLDPFYDTNSLNRASVFSNKDNSSSAGQNNMAQGNVSRAASTEATRQRPLLQDQTTGATSPWQSAARSDGDSSLREAGAQIGLFEAQFAQNRGHFERTINASRQAHKLHQFQEHIFQAQPLHNQMIGQNPSSQSLPLLAAQPSHNQKMIFGLQEGQYVGQNPSSESRPLFAAQPSHNQKMIFGLQEGQYVGQNPSSQSRPLFPALPPQNQMKAPAVFATQRSQNEMISISQPRSQQLSEQSISRRQMIAARAQQLHTAAANPSPVKGTALKQEGGDDPRTSNSGGTDSSGSRLSDLFMDVGNNTDVILCGEELHKAFDSDSESPNT
jgi:hypothetical protein